MAKKSKKKFIAIIKAIETKGSSAKFYRYNFNDPKKFEPFINKKFYKWFFYNRYDQKTGNKVLINNITLKTRKF